VRIMVLSRSAATELPRLDVALQRSAATRLSFSESWSSSAPPRCRGSNRATM
jgi:hypothetical protein